jgi:hypothetical protein
MIKGYEYQTELRDIVSCALDPGATHRCRFVLQYGLP